MSEKEGICNTYIHTYIHTHLQILITIYMKPSIFSDNKLYSLTYSNNK